MYIDAEVLKSERGISQIAREEQLSLYPACKRDFHYRTSDLFARSLELRRLSRTFGHILRFTQKPSADQSTAAQAGKILSAADKSFSASSDESFATQTTGFTCQDITT